MKIKSVHIKNFRSIKDQTITCSNQTILIGGNGVGKSTVLKALRAFFDNSFKPKPDDYFAKNVKDPIEVAVTFFHFKEEEKKEFSSRIHNGEMTVTRAFGGENSEDGTYHGLISGAIDFQEVRNAKGAADIKEAYKKLIDKYEFPAYTNKDAVEATLIAWEKKNPDKCQYIKDDGQFLGFKNVGSGKLQRAANFIFIEAVRDASQDASDQKSSAIGQLMDLIVRSAMQQNAEIKQYQQEVDAKYAELTRPDNFPALGTLEKALTDSLNTIYQDTGVKLNWQPADGVVMPPPKAQIRFNEDKLEYPVELAGNGVQRAFIIALLHQLLVAKSQSETIPTIETKTDEEKKKEEDATAVLKNMPSVILAVEEPELYQHPTKQWHFAQVLKKLSSGGMLEVFGDVQVIFCTHSPNFIDLSEFHNTRIACKKEDDETKVKETRIKSASLLDVAKDIEKIYDLKPGSCTEDSIQSRLHIFGTELSEGFFADGVILVEGISDKAALQTVSELINNSLIQNNIAVLSVEGKSNIDKPWLVFTHLDIPVFPLWDGDKGKKDQIKNNQALQKMLGVDKPRIVEYPVGVYANYACFEQDLNEQIKVEMGADYESVFLTACGQFNLSADLGRKNPYVISEMIRTYYKSGKKLPTLEKIVTTAIQHIVKK